MHSTRPAQDSQDDGCFLQIRDIGQAPGTAGITRGNARQMTLNHRFCIAPMMDWSDRHCRYFWRLLTREALLYTEMVSTNALLHGDRERLLQFTASEQPLALQLGGNDPVALARCASWAEARGYAEVNLNCGCPSGRVQSGLFGACLMAQPELVADCVRAMREACTIPVSVKHRIGIDAMESFAELLNFVERVAAGGCDTFIVHARKAWLRGLSPRQNREIPPLHYNLVYRLQRERPDLTVVVNGGIESLAACEQHLAHVNGVMLGRGAYRNPFMLAEVDARLFASTRPPPGRELVVARLLPYIERELAGGARLHHITRHILGLYQNLPGARGFRRYLSRHAHRAEAGLDVLQDALALTAA